jgi:UDP-N-acetyl-D-mannosaminuronate dehydrogenase
MRVSVLGCGYLGAVRAVTMTELGHEVVGIDVDHRKLDALSRGVVLRAGLRGPPDPRPVHRSSPLLG